MTIIAIEVWENFSIWDMIAETERDGHGKTYTVASKYRKS